MRVKLLKPYRNRRAGAEFVPAWEAEARALVANGTAVPVGRAAPEAVAAEQPKTAKKAKPKPAKKAK